MTRAAGVVLGATGAISVVTAINRLDLLPTKLLASSPESVADGRVWLLLTSALVADRPAVASIAGFALVGLAAVALCGARVVWLAAASGHVGSAVVVYAAIVFARLADLTPFHTVFTQADYGTSAVIAAWIGAAAYRLWTRGLEAPAVVLCLASALAGWLLKGDVTVLDAEHAVSLVCGVLAMRYGPRLAGPAVELDRVRLGRRQRRLAGRHGPWAAVDAHVPQP